MNETRQELIERYQRQLAHAEETHDVQGAAILRTRLRRFTNEPGQREVAAETDRG